MKVFIEPFYLTVPSVGQDLLSLPLLNELRDFSGQSLFLVYILVIT